MLCSCVYIASESFTVELNIPSTVYAGQTVGGNCTYTGKHRPDFIKIKTKHPNCSVEGLPAAHELLRPSQYVNDFNVTCSRSNITFELKCFAYCPSTNEHENTNKTVQGMLHFMHICICFVFFCSDSPAKDSHSSSHYYCY